MKKPVHRAMYLEDALIALLEMEKTAAELECNDVFQAFTPDRKDTLPRCAHPICCAHLEHDTAQEQLAS